MFEAFDMDLKVLDVSIIRIDSLREYVSIYDSCLFLIECLLILAESKFLNWWDGLKCSIKIKVVGNYKSLQVFGLQGSVLEGA